MDNQKLADLLYPNARPIKYWFERYPERKLAKGAQVTRFAPSPTGFLHIGGVYMAMISYTIAKQTGGVCMLRIEDTDQNREVRGGIDAIVNGINAFGLKFDEGKTTLDADVGYYGPYVQSKRTDIYRSFAREMVLRGKAYPCFCTAEDLKLMRAEQEQNKQNPGYYGQYAKCRDLTFEQIKENIQAGKKWVLRFKCPYTIDDKMQTHDLVRGDRLIPCNYNDVVIIKSDGTPPYNFAHVVDDTLMHTTLVVRGDEWLSSLTEHLQLFEALGLTPPKYAHTSTIQKIDLLTGERRKISKRKDPEANVEFFARLGYPDKSVLDYLMTLANSNFEDWRTANPSAPLLDFVFDISKINTSGALFDIVKLNDVSKNTISNMTATQVYQMAHAWASKFDAELLSLMDQDPAYYTAILNIDRDIPKPRKDISHWAELKSIYSYMFDDSFDANNILFPDKFTSDQIKYVLAHYASYYDTKDDQNTWFGRIKDLAQDMGFAREVKDYKKAPNVYPGHCGDVSTILRVALTGRTMTPNLYDICKLLGKERIEQRLQQVLANIK